MTALSSSCLDYYVVGLSFKVEGRDDMYMFPSLLPRKKLSVIWKRDESKKVYVGRRQVCSSQMTTFSSSTFGMFQSKICTTLDKMAQLWRDGLVLSQGHAVHSHVECLVTMHIVDLVRSVDFVCRGGKGTEAECVSLLDTVMSLWSDMLDRYSPGTKHQTEYLSRKHLEEHRELTQVAVYSDQQIEGAKQTGEGANAAVKQVVGDERVVESLGDLLVVKSQAALVTLSAVAKAVITGGSAQWYSFGATLGFSHDRIEALCHDKVTPADKLFALVQVKANQVGPVQIDNLLLEACQHLPTPIDGVVKEKLRI